MSTFLSFLIALTMVGLTLFVHARSLRLILGTLPKLAETSFHWPVRVAVFGCFLSHIIHILIYTFGYFLAVQVWDLGGIAAASELTPGPLSFLDYLYFSASSYTALGLGDLYPEGGVRIIVAMESLNGLLMIAWTASFTYLTMERFGIFHGRPQI